MSFENGSPDTGSMPGELISDAAAVDSLRLLGPASLVALPTSHGDPA